MIFHRCTKKKQSDFLPERIWRSQKPAQQHHWRKWKSFSRFFSSSAVSRHLIVNWMGEKGKEREIECERREEKCGNFYEHLKRKEEKKVENSNETKQRRILAFDFSMLFSDNFLCAPNVQQTRKTEENFMSFQYTSIASLFLQFMPEKKSKYPWNHTITLRLWKVRNVRNFVYTIFFSSWMLSAHHKSNNTNKSLFLHETRVLRGDEWNLSNRL